MRVVLDSSILIAAIAHPGTCTELTDEVAREHILVLSRFVLSEVERKLVGKFGVTLGEARSLVIELKDLGELVEPVEVSRAACRDATDLPALGTMVAGKVDLLVTVDKELLDLDSYQGIPIRRPGLAFRLLRGLP